MKYSHLPQETDDHGADPLLWWLPCWDVADTVEAGATLDHNRDRAPAVSEGDAQAREACGPYLHGFRLGLRLVDE
jgi:hypothetical protein